MPMKVLRITGVLALLAGFAWQAFVAFANTAPIGRVVTTKKIEELKQDEREAIPKQEVGIYIINTAKEYSELMPSIFIPNMVMLIGGLLILFSSKNGDSSEST